MGVFQEVEFPRTIGFKAMGGPTFSTTVNEGFSGFEQRNQNWVQARGEWNVSLTTPSPADIDSLNGSPLAANYTPQNFIDQLTAFFLICGGRANGFRLYDHKDNSNGSLPQLMGTGDGQTSAWQLLKFYTAGGESYVRFIQKPITSSVVDYLGNSLNDSVTVFLNDVAQPANEGYVGGGSTAKYTLDHTTGLVSWLSATEIAINSVTIANGVATYTYQVLVGNPVPENAQIDVSAMLHSENEGLFLVTATGAGAAIGTYTFSVENANAIAESYAVGIYTGRGLICAAEIAITGATNSGSSTTYAYSSAGGNWAPTIGMRLLVPAGSFSNAGNNGSFMVTSVGSGSVTVNNPSGATQSGGGGAFLDWTPAPGVVITATYEFDYPVRFDTDKLAIQIEDSNVEGGQPIVTWNTILLKELKMSSGSQG